MNQDANNIKLFNKKIGFLKSDSIFSLSIHLIYLMSFATCGLFAKITKSKPTHKKII
jgi:hypothetical protein